MENMAIEYAKNILEEFKELKKQEKNGGDCAVSRWLEDAVSDTRAVVDMASKQVKSFELHINSLTWLEINGFTATVKIYGDNKSEWGFSNDFSREVFDYLEEIWGVL